MSKELLDKYQAWVFDTDSTTADSCNSAIRLLQRFLKRYCSNPNLNFSKDQVDGWMYFVNILINNGFGIEEAQRIDKNLWNSSWVLGRPKPIDGAPELIALLHDHGRTVLATTSRPDIKNIHALTIKWIQNQLSGVDNIYMNPSDSNLDGPIFKASVLIKAAQTYGSAVLVDDSPNHAEKILELVESSGKDLDIHIILVPYAKVQVPKELSANPRLTVIHRGMNQSIKPVQEWLMNSVAHS